MNKKFYVYAILDPNKKNAYEYGDYKFRYEPFYIGKGNKRRRFTHLNDNLKDKTFKANKIRKIIRTGNKPIIKLVKNRLTEEEAFDLEKLLIKIIGRRDLKLGPLTNLTDGGDGTANRTQEATERIRKALKGKKRSKEIGEKISKKLMGRPLSKLHKRKISKAHKGKKLNENQLKALNNTGKVFSTEHRNKISISNKKADHSKWTFKGNRHSEFTKIKMKISQNKRYQNNKVSELTKKRISESLIGHIGWNKGIQLKEEVKVKIKKALKGKELSENHKENLKKNYKIIKSNDVFILRGNKEVIIWCKHNSVSYKNFFIKSKDKDYSVISLGRLKTYANS